MEASLGVFKFKPHLTDSHILAQNSFFIYVTFSNINKLELEQKEVKYKYKMYENIEKSIKAEIYVHNRFDCYVFGIKGIPFCSVYPHGITDFDLKYLPNNNDKVEKGEEEGKGRNESENAGIGAKFVVLIHFFLFPTTYHLQIHLTHRNTRIVSTLNALSGVLVHVVLNLATARL
ncbi:CLUMA_CG019657, isoform A [Clunio marinus]|uniref:CLUMA_CG019657, isoform A n=1 Tax=Clunio marinus TaxID=568069 RepID=A0A1J1J430_9DIPT|nr:CLUMA_CG019657, isoform A [Clunio marinus]